MQVATIKVKADNAGGYRLINASDFDPKKHQAYDADAKAAVKQTDAEREASEKLAAERKVQANFGQVDGNGLRADGKNPSGTFSEPTPTDIRYPDKDATEFENNHGAFVGASAADLREQAGLDDKPGGLKPEVHEALKADEQNAALATAQAADAGKPGGNPDAADADEVEFDDMTVPQLKEYAKANDVDLAGATTKAGIRAAIDKAAE